MSKKHTPGPWKAGRPDTGTLVEGVESKWVYAGKKYVAAAWGGDVKAWDEVMANARLIAAAPELLEAAKMARSAIDQLMGDSDLPEDDSPEMKACQALSHAIAKATGGKP